MSKKILMTCFMCVLTVIPFVANAFDNVYFDGTSPYTDKNDTLIFDGVRAKGDGVNLNDALRFEYKFDLPSLNFVIQKQTTYHGVGIFDDQSHMAINVTPAQPSFTANGASYQFNQSYTVTASQTKPFIAKLSLKTGHVISWLLQKSTSDFSYEFYGNNIDYTFAGEANQGVISGSQKILLKGVYYLKIKPTSSETMTFSLKMFNANNRLLHTVEDGSYISDTFATDLRDYSKYKVHLTTGQTIALEKPSDSNIEFRLVNNFGANVASTVGLALIFQATKSGDYYLFINNRKGWGGSYSSSVSITSSLRSKQSTDKVRQPTFDKATAAKPESVE